MSPDNVLYQVVMAGSAGFRKAEPWPWPPHSWTGSAERPRAVALVPDSLLARNYPVVAEGKPLSTVNRADFLNASGKPDHYIFPNEQLAKLAAQLDEAIAPQSGLTAWREHQSWILSDGQRAFRIYHYQSDNLGKGASLDTRFAEKDVEPLPCEQGPRYWRYIPGWKEAASDAENDPASLESIIETVMAEMAQVMPDAHPPPTTKAVAKFPVATPMNKKPMEKPVDPTPPEPEAKTAPVEKADSIPKPVQETPPPSTPSRPKTTKEKTGGSQSSPRRKSKKPSRKRSETMIIAIDIG